MSKSDSKRQAILENAYRLFRAQGFDGTSMANITSQVGGSKATLYSHFPSKAAALGKISPALLGIISPVWWQSLAHDLEPRSMDWRIE